MSMDGISTTQLRANLSAAANAVRKAKPEADDQVLAAQAEITGIHIGARAAERAVLDDVAVAMERREQYDWVLNGDSQPQVEVPVTPPEGEALIPVLDEAPPDQTAEQVVVHVYDPRKWTGLQWFCAAFGVVVGLFFASATKDFDKLHGFGHGVFTFVWYIACAGTGFFGGGLIGRFIEELKERRNRS